MPQDLPEQKPKNAHPLVGFAMIAMMGFAVYGCSALVSHGSGKSEAPTVTAPTPPASKSAVTPSVTPPPAVRPTADDKVLAIQTQLNQAGELNVQMTGYMDTWTQAAIKHFQRAHGLTPDGVVGPKTQKALAAVATAGRAKAAVSAETPNTSTVPPTGCAATPEFAQYSDVIARIDCNPDDHWVDVYIHDDAWLNATHYERVALRDLLEKAFQRDARLISADTNQRLDVNGGAR